KAEQQLKGGSDSLLRMAEVGVPASAGLVRRPAEAGTPAPHPPLSTALPPGTSGSVAFVPLCFLCLFVFFVAIPLQTSAPPWAFHFSISSLLPVLPSAR